MEIKKELNKIVDKLELKDINFEENISYKLTNNKYLIVNKNTPKVFGIHKTDSDNLEIKAFDISEVNNILIPHLKYHEDELLITSVNIGNKQVPLTFEFGQILGILCGDGWWSHDLEKGQLTSFYLADAEAYNAKYIKTHFPKLVQEFTTINKRENKKQAEDDGRYGDTVKYTFNLGSSGKNFIRFLINNFGGERDLTTSGSANKRLPDFIVNTPREFRLGILNGLIATDGSISINNSLKNKSRLLINFSSTSKMLIQQVSSLCSSLSIATNMSLSQVTSKGNNSYELSISVSDCKKLNIFQDLCHKRKQEIFKNTYVELENPANIKYNNVPFPKFLQDLILSYITCKKIALLDLEDPDYSYQSTKTHFFTTLCHNRNLGYISRYTANKIFKYLEEEYYANLQFKQNGIKLLTEFINNAQNLINDKYYIFNQELSDSIRALVTKLAPKHLVTKEIYDYSRNKLLKPLSSCLNNKKIQKTFLHTIFAWVTQQNIKALDMTNPIITSFKNDFIDNVNINWVTVAK